MDDGVDILEGELGGQVPAGLGRSILAQIVRAAHVEGLWAPLLRFAVELEARTQRDAIKLIRAWRRRDARGLLDAIAGNGLPEELAVLTRRLPAAERAAFEPQMAALDA